MGVTLTNQATGQVFSSGKEERASAASAKQERVYQSKSGSVSLTVKQQTQQKETAGASPRPTAYDSSDEQDDAGSLSFWQRVWNTVKGSAKQGTGSVINSTATLYDTRGGDSTKAELQETGETYRRQAQRFSQEYQEMLEDNRRNPGTWSDELLEKQKRMAEMAAEAAGNLESFSERDIHREAADAAYGLGDELSASGAGDIEKAKEGLGTLGRLAVDAGVAGTQMLGDAAANIVAPGAGLASMGYRAFGSGAQQARLNGATLAQQLGYGAASAGVEVLSEKIFDGLAGIYGGGAADDIVDGVIRKMAKSKNGQRALRVLSSGAGEALEEVISGAVSPALESIYDGKDPLSHYSKETVTDMLHDAAVGGILGGLGGAVSVAKGKYKPGGNAQTAQESAQETAGARIAQQETVDTAHDGNAAEAATDPLAKILFGQEKTATSEVTAERSERDTYTVVNKLKENINSLSGMEPVAQTSASVVNTVSGTTMAEKARKLFDAIKGVVTRPNFGDVEINGRSVKDDLSHGVGPAKAATIAAVPNVIRDGQQIYFKENWKNRGYDGYVFAAPVTMDGNPVYVAAVVTKTSKNRFYLHEVVDSNGNIIKIDDGESATPTSLAANGDAGAQFSAVQEDQKVGPPTDVTIAQESDSVNYGGGEGTVGAAAAGFTNSAYGDLQLESSQFHSEGANAARPVDVPMYDGNGNPVSRFASNMMGAKAIPDDVIPLIQQMVADGELSYQARGNKNVRNQAMASIREKGFDGAMEQLRNAVGDGKSDVDTIALGTELLVNAANAGDANAMAEIAALMQTSSTRVGQAMQYFTVLRKLDPNAQLYAAQKTVEQLSNKVQGRNKSADKIDIPQDLLEKFMAQTDQEGRDAVMEEIYQKVADQVPPTWKDKWDAWRYMAMLTNPRTHIRNIVGNLGFQPVRFVKNELAAGMERLFNVKEKTKSFASSPAMYRAAWSDYDNVGKLLNGNRYSGVKGEIESRRRIFDNKALEAVRKGNSASLDFEDVVFKRITYADALAGYLTANGVKAEQLDGGTVPADLLSRARDYAASEALKATYQDDNAASRKVQEVGKTLGVVGEAILPFKKTPANILVRGFEYSPAGLAKALTYDLAKVQRGEMSAAQAIDSVASGLTGTGLFALGAYLFAQGLVTGAKGDDKEDKWSDLLGHQGYALELQDGTSVTLDWLAPEALPFFMGAEFMSSVGESGWTGDEIVSALLDATKSVADPIIEMSMLQGVNDLIESVRYADGAPLSAMIPSVITSYLSQAIPTALGQVERTSEPVRMTTYTDKNSKIPTDLQYAIGRASARIPGLDYQQIPYIDAWGRTEESGDVLVRAVNNTLNPAYISKVEVDNVEQELQRLYDATGEGGVFPGRAEKSFKVDGEDKYLSAEEYVKYAKELGQSSYQLVRDGMATGAYKSMSDTEKTEYISDLYSYAKAAAKANAGGNALDDWQKNAKTAQRDIGVSTVEYIALYQKYGHEILTGKAYDKTKEAVGAGLTVDQYASMRNRLDKDGNGSVSQAEAQEKLDSMDFTNEQKDQLWTIINKSWKNNPYA